MSEQMQIDRLNAARLEALKASAARERLQKLFDVGTFVELDVYAKSSGVGSGVITGYGEVDGVTVFAFSQDVENHGGAVGKAQAGKIARVYELAVKVGSPVVGIYDSKGADIAQGNEMLAAYGAILEKCNNLSGVVPQIALVLGVCGGVSAMMACSADFVVMSAKAELFLTPPAVSKDSTEYGGAEAALRSGVAHIVEEDEELAIASARRLLEMLPENNLSPTGSFDFTPPYDTSIFAEIPAKLDSISKCDLVKAIADDGSFLLLSNGFGKGAHTSLVTIGGGTVGMVVAGGPLDHNGAARIARFVSVCDSFQIPVVTLINTEGVRASGKDELAGAVRDMARLGQIYAEASTPKIAVVMGSAIGSAYVALSRADVALAWPDAVISPMPVSAAVAFLKGSEITEAHTREMTEEDYRAGEASALAAAESGIVQDVIAPADTRDALIRALDMLAGKRVQRLPKKHANLPM